MIRENDPLFLYTTELLAQKLFDQGSKVVSNPIITPGGPKAYVISNLIEDNARVVVLSCYEQQAVDILCEAYQQDWIHDIVWLGLGWWAEGRF